MKAILTAAVLFLMQVVASASIHKIACKHSGGIDRGTAVCVGTVKDGRSVFFTAGHCVRPNQKQVWISSKNDWHSATVVDAMENTRVDYAICLAKVPGCKPEDMGKEPMLGQAVIYTGYTKSGYQKRYGKVSNWTDKNRQGFWTKGDQSISGQSGGPCWDNDRKLVGIISARTTGSAVFTSATYITARWRSICSPFG